MNHTPGPWEVDENDLMIFSAGGNGKRIADTMPHDEDDMPDDEWRANAVLIAAAPELLAALEAMLAAGSAYGCDFTQNNPRIAMQARAAIAKAKGE